jgi:hypothetical protein
MNNYILKNYERSQEPPKTNFTVLQIGFKKWYNTHNEKPKPEYQNFINTVRSVKEAETHSTETWNKQSYPEIHTQIFQKSNSHLKILGVT